MIKFQSIVWGVSGWLPLLAEAVERFLVPGAKISLQRGMVNTENSYDYKASSKKSSPPSACALHRLFPFLRRLFLPSNCPRNLGS